MNGERKKIVDLLFLKFSEMNGRQHETFVFMGDHLKLYPGISEATRNFLGFHMYVA